MGQGMYCSKQIPVTGIKEPLMRCLEWAALEITEHREFPGAFGTAALLRAETILAALARVTMIES